MVVSAIQMWLHSGNLLVEISGSSVVPRSPAPKATEKYECVRSRVHNPPECATPIQLCIGSWSSGIGSSDVMRTLHTSARPVSRQGTIVFDPRVPATARVPLGCVRYYDAKIRFRSTKTLCRAGSGVAHSGGLCTLGTMCHLILHSHACHHHATDTQVTQRQFVEIIETLNLVQQPK